MMVDFQAYAGPGDKGLRMTEVEGYQPVSRIGEIVMNSFVDAYEFTELADSLTKSELTGGPALAADPMVETKPHFYEWATVQPGMICVARKKRTAVFRQYVAAETAIPVIACAACKGKDEASDYFFAGVARSKSVRAPDDGIGPSVDEFFTVSLGGMSTVLNTSGAPLSPGDNVEWTFFTERGTSTGKRQKSGPRRIGVQLCSVSSPRAIGRVLTFAKAGEPFDLLIKQ